VPGEHQVVDHLAAERLGGACEAAGGTQVGFAGSRVPARVVVGEEDCGSTVPRSFDDDGAQWKVDPAGVPLVQREVETARLFVEVSDPQAFLAGILLLEAANEELPSRGKAIEGEGSIGTLMTHSLLLGGGNAGGDANRVGFGA